jgi:hypothetical protein
MEQGVNVKLPSETLEMLKQLMANQHKCFKDANDDERTGSPVMKRTDENVTKIRESVRPDRRLTCRMLADSLI